MYVSTQSTFLSYVMLPHVNNEKEITQRILTSRKCISYIIYLIIKGEMGENLEITQFRWDFTFSALHAQFF